MKKELSQTNKTIFEQIREIDENNNEFWGARKLSKILKYSEYRHFLPVIERAKEACKNSGYRVSDHIEDILDMVKIGSGAERQLDDGVKLSRYAC